MYYNYSTSTREASVCFVLSVVVIYFYSSVICRFFALELDLADLDCTIGKRLENFEWGTETLKNCCTAMKNV